MRETLNEYVRESAECVQVCVSLGVPVSKYMRVSVTLDEYANVTV